MNHEIILHNLSLQETLHSGQAFRWVPDGDGFLGVVAGRCARLSQQGDDARVFCEEQDADFWQSYFDEGRDYAALTARWRDDPAAGPALAALPGLRVLRQPLWETVVAFILSQNNNDARIRACVDRVCRAAGAAYSVGETALHDIPSPDALLALGEEGLRALGVGYRAGYLIAAARWMGTPEAALGGLPYREARAALTRVRGIGEKVADCIALFGLGHGEAFPVDVWIQRAAAPHFPKAKSKSALSEAAAQRWGADAGCIQQALFHAARKDASSRRKYQRIPNEEE